MINSAEKFGAGNIVGQAAGALGMGGGGHGGNAYGGGQGGGYGGAGYGGMSVGLKVTNHLVGTC